MADEGTSDASWNALDLVAQEEQVRRQAAIKAVENGGRNPNPSTSSAPVGSVADKGAPGRSLAQIVGASRRA